MYTEITVVFLMPNWNYYYASKKVGSSTHKKTNVDKNVKLTLH
jgi:hypothetical protein